MKQKTVRGNQASFMNKILSRTFMQRSEFQNNLNKNPTSKNKHLYRQQRNYCVTLLKTEKKKSYNSLDLKILDDNKRFWQLVKPLFSEKQNYLQKNIMLKKEKKILSDNEIVAEKLNNLFIEKVENLDIERFYNDLRDINEAVIIEEILKIYEYHPSVIKIKENITLEMNSHLTK